MPTKQEHDGLYEIWHGMVRRCHDPKRKDYSKYGGRGIRVCEKWRGTAMAQEWNMTGFLEFEAWAIKNGYKPGLTLDRICNNRGYQPNNVRWISKKQQAYNRKTNRYITIKGKTKTLEQWGKEYNIGPDVILHRLERGWDMERAITQPVRKKVKK